MKEDKNIRREEQEKQKLDKIIERGRRIDIKPISELVNNYYSYIKKVFSVFFVLSIIIFIIAILSIFFSDMEDFYYILIIGICTFILALSVHLYCDKQLKDIKESNKYKKIASKYNIEDINDSLKGIIDFKSRQYVLTSNYLVGIRKVQIACLDKIIYISERVIQGEDTSIPMLFFIDEEEKQYNFRCELVEARRLVKLISQSRQIMNSDYDKWNHKYKFTKKNVDKEFISLCLEYKKNKESL